MGARTEEREVRFCDFCNEAVSVVEGCACCKKEFCSKHGVKVKVIAAGSQLCNGDYASLQPQLRDLLKGFGLKLVYGDE